VGSGLKRNGVDNGGEKRLETLRVEVEEMAHVGGVSKGDGSNDRGSGRQKDP